MLMWQARLIRIRRKVGRRLLRTRQRFAISRVLFSLTLVVLLAVAAGGFLFYASRGGQGTNASSETVAFTVADAKTFGTGSLSLARLSDGNYSLTISATGLQPASAGNYVVQAVQKSGTFSTVPIAGSGYGGLNASAFAGDAQGNGHFSITLSSDPGSTYSLVSISFLPGGVFRNGTVVATCKLTPLSGSSSTSGKGGTNQIIGSTQGNPVTAIELYNDYNLGGIPKDNPQYTNHTVYVTGKLNSIINIPATNQVETGMDTNVQAGQATTNSVEYWYWTNSTGLPAYAGEQTVLAKCLVQGLVTSQGPPTLLILTGCSLISVG